MFMTRVLLLGAGASRGTLGEKAPISAQFGKCLHRNIKDWTNKYPYLSAAVKFFKERIQNTSMESWALDKIWGAIDNRVKLRYIINSIVCCRAFFAFSLKLRTPSSFREDILLAF